MQIKITYDEAKKVLEKAITAQIGNIKYCVTGIEFDTYSKSIEVTLEPLELEIPEGPPTEYPNFTEEVT